MAEYWNDAQQRWILVDAQLDSFQCDAMKIPFNPLDVPRDQFIVGGRAWQMCRTGQSDPDQFGIFDMHGLWFIRDMGESSMINAFHRQHVRRSLITLTDR